MSNIIVMAFSPRNFVGCLLKKRPAKGGVTGTPGPPPLRPGSSQISTLSLNVVKIRK